MATPDPADPRTDVLVFLGALFGLTLLVIFWTALGGGPAGALAGEGAVAAFLGVLFVGIRGNHGWAWALTAVLFGGLAAGGVAFSAMAWLSDLSAGHGVAAGGIGLMRLFGPFLTAFLSLPLIGVVRAWRHRRARAAAATAESARRRPR